MGNTTASALHEKTADIDVTPDLLLLIQQKLCIVQYRYGSLSLKFHLNADIDANKT